MPTNKATFSGARLLNDMLRARSAGQGVSWCCRGGLAILIAMSNVTDILSSIEQGDSKAAEKLLPLVYEELRKLAAAKLAHEMPGQTLQATALLHEADLRLAGKSVLKQLAVN
jgi:hypothetical protein